METQDHNRHASQKVSSGNNTPSVLFLILGYFLSIPPIVVGGLFLLMTASFALESRLILREDMRWNHAMFAWLAFFLGVSAMKKEIALRGLMYGIGAAVIYSSAVFYTWNAVRMEQLNLSNHDCSGAGMAQSLLAFERLSSLSAISSVVLISLGTAIATPYVKSPCD